MQRIPGKQVCSAGVAVTAELFFVDFRRAGEWGFKGTIQARHPSRNKTNTRPMLSPVGYEGFIGQQFAFRVSDGGFHGTAWHFETLCRTKMKVKPSKAITVKMTGNEVNSKDCIILNPLQESMMCSSQYAPGLT